MLPILNFILYVKRIYNLKYKANFQFVQESLIVAVPGVGKAVHSCTVVGLTAASATLANACRLPLLLLVAMVLPAEAEETEVLFTAPPATAAATEAAPASTCWEDLNPTPATTAVRSPPHNHLYRKEGGKQGNIIPCTNTDTS